VDDKVSLNMSSKVGGQYSQSQHGVKSCGQKSKFKQFCKGGHGQ
jgi:hypothetical protein